MTVSPTANRRLTDVLFKFTHTPVAPPQKPLEQAMVPPPCAWGRPRG